MQVLFKLDWFFLIQDAYNCTQLQLSDVTCRHVCEFFHWKFMSNVVPVQNHLLIFLESSAFLLIFWDEVFDAAAFDQLADAILPNLQVWKS